MALGSTPRDLFRMVLSQTGTALVIGVIAGIAAASQMTWVLSAWLFGLSPTEPAAFLSVAVTLVLVGLAAAWYPARMAAAVDPTEALRD